MAQPWNFQGVRLNAATRARGASGGPDHAMVDGTGRVRGIPKERRAGLGKLISAD